MKTLSASLNFRITHRVLPDERAAGLVQTVAREQNATADVGETVNAKQQHRCCPEYLLGTRENRLLLFLVTEICSHLHSKIKHLHPDTAHSFHRRNVVYPRIHLASKPGFLELVSACL